MERWLFPGFYEARRHDHPQHEAFAASCLVRVHRDLKWGPVREEDVYKPHRARVACTQATGFSLTKSISIGGRLHSWIVL